MQRVHDYIKEAGVYYLATVDGDQPRVRPFGTINIFDNKLYIQTGKSKDVAKQILNNGKVEISAMKGDTWIRVEGTLVEAYDGRDDVVFFAKLVPESSVVLKTGDFAVLYPSDIHRPQAAVEGEESEVIKVVVKVAVDLLKK